MSRACVRLICGLCGLWPVIALATANSGEGAPKPSEHVAAEVEVYPQTMVHEVSPQLVGANLELPSGGKSLLMAPATLARVKEMGIKSIRFPVGCLADRYNWKNPPKDQPTVDEFLDFCEAVGAEACFTLNLQGGTEGLVGSPPADTIVEESIRYRHTAPNSCGDTDYYYGTLYDALALFRKYTIERGVSGQRPLTRFVLGNENWNRAGSDWPPDVYRATCEVYARSILNAVIDFNEEQAKLDNVDIRFVMTGYPTLGRDGQLFAAGEQAANAAWTGAIDSLSGLIEAVQEPISITGGGSSGMEWMMPRLNKVLQVRNGPPEELQGEDEGPKLKYDLPMEWTESELDCAGPATATTRGADGIQRQLHQVDAMSAMLESGALRIHCRLFGDGPCGLLSTGGGERDNSQAFKLLAGRIGEQLVKTDVETADLSSLLPTDRKVAGADAVTSPAQDVPVLSAVTTRHGKELYVLLVNRSSDRPVQASIRLRGCTVKPEGEVRTLAGAGLETQGAKVKSASLAVSNPLVRLMAPSSAEVIRLELDEVNERPIVLSTKRFDQSVRIGADAENNSFVVSTSGGPSVVAEPDPMQAGAIPAPPKEEPVRFAVYTDADWIHASPSLGEVMNEQPQTVEVSYSTGLLAPGHYKAQVIVVSPDTYNSPQRIQVDLTVRPVRPDFDGDGDVDQEDFEKFVACMLASPAVQASPACAPARLAGRNYVDMDDYYLFESCISGPNRRPGEECSE